MECGNKERIEKLEGELAGLSIKVTQISQLLSSVLKSRRNTIISGDKVGPVSDANYSKFQRTGQEASKNVCHLTIYLNTFKKSGVVLSDFRRIDIFCVILWD